MGATGDTLESLLVYYVNAFISKFLGEDWSSLSAISYEANHGGHSSASILILHRYVPLMSVMFTGSGQEPSANL